ncbi:sensor histidine kinase [Nocardioides albus]|uniref:histidine kinase n=1 Tax=Nocardioides albus TaxID=1841 RepID=A0A7W5A9F4_9ACTN|nr:histidine kinase [Nocardioides albus]MBB3092128.1 signal transduction histidine kinase [Nocardioides albus]
MSLQRGWSSSGDNGREKPWLVDLLFAAVLALLLLPASASTVWDSTWPLAGRVAVVAAVGLAHATVAVRRVRPRVAYLLVCAVMAVLVALPEMTRRTDGFAFHPILLPSTLLFPVLLYAIAAWRSPRESLLALGVACVGAGAVTWRLWGADYLTVAQPGLASSEDPVRSWQLFLILGVVATIAVPWGLGRYRRLRAQYVLALEERARREEQHRAESAAAAAAQERVRIAREMHDVVAHSLSVMVTQAEGGRMMAARDPAAGARVLDTVARTGQEAMQDMRSLLDALHDPHAARDDPAPQPSLRVLPELIEKVRASGPAVTYAEHGTASPLGSAGELAAYRVVQEALTNVLKHAGPDADATVALRWTADQLTISVSNHAGHAVVTAPRSGRGLVGMAERLALLDGTLHAGPAGEDGFQLVATIPTLASAAVGEAQ